MVGFHSDAITPWKRFLLMNPQLANGGLFLHYYTKQRMLMDPDARHEHLLIAPSFLCDVSELNLVSFSAILQVDGAPP